METGGSSPRSQEFATYPYPELHHSSSLFHPLSWRPILMLPCYITYIFQVFSFPQVTPIHHHSFHLSLIRTTRPANHILLYFITQIIFVQKARGRLNVIKEFFGTSQLLLYSRNPSHHTMRTLLIKLANETNYQLIHLILIECNFLRQNLTQLPSCTFSSLRRCGPTRARASSFKWFLDHIQRPHSIVLLWMSDQPVTETSTCTTHNTHNRHLCPDGIRTRNPSKRADADPRLRPRGQWDWLDSP
jgi:hypothetical protein